VHVTYGCLHGGGVYKFAGTTASVTFADVSEPGITRQWNRSAPK
jgi:hypothetical protein